MPTATAPKTKGSSAQAELDRLEAEWATAKADADKQSRDYSAKLAEAQTLSDERRRLIHREPGLATHTGEPSNPDNPVAAIDKKTAALGDLLDRHAQVEHARRIADRSKQDVDEHIATHFDELATVEEERARADVDAANAALATAADKADAVLARCHRLMGLANAARRDNRVSALDAVSGFTRTLRAATMPAPKAKR